MLLFPQYELSHFSSSVYRQWVPLVSATSLTVLYWSFWNFAFVFFMVWGCACGLDIIVSFFVCFFFHFFHIVNLVIFHLHYIDNGYLLWAQLLLQFYTDHYETLQMFSSWYKDVHVVFDIIVRLFFYFFYIVNLVIFHPQYIDSEHNSSYNFTPIVFKLCRCFFHSLKMCMCILYNPCLDVCYFFLLCELCHFLTSDV